MTFTAMSPDDVRYAALTTEFVAAMLAGDQERASRALLDWSAATTNRVIGQALQAARILADDAVQQAVAPIEERLGALEKKVGDGT